MSVGIVDKKTGDRIPTAGMPAIDSVLSGISTNPVQNRVVKAALDEKADTDIVASDFSAATSYTAGNYCIYEGKFYKFKNNHSGAWAVADVDEIKIAGELSSLKSGLTKQDVSNEFTVDTTYIDNFKAYKINNIVYLSFKIKAQIADNTALITPASDVAIDTYLYCMSSIYKSDGSLFTDGAIWIDKGFTVLTYYGSASSPNTGYVSMSYVTA